MQDNWKVERNHKYFQHLEQEESSEMLKEFSVFLLRVEKYGKCEETLMKYLRKNHNDSFVFYMLAYIMIEKNEIEVAILAMKILTKLQPRNKEFWIILMMLYEKTGFKSGVDYCTIEIPDKQFMTEDVFKIESLVSIEPKICDDISKILHHQMKFKLRHFLDLTRKFGEITSFKNQSEESYENLKELMEEEKFDDALELVKSFELTDDNEIFIRIMKGNILFALGDNFKGICEYEIAYNLCLKKKFEFPRLLSIRCGDFYLSERENLPKARRYFHHCCTKSPTFEALMGLGIVCYREENFTDAEKYFAEANKIDKKSGDNWIYLAMTNYQLHRVEMFEKCYSISSKFTVKNSQLNEEAEKALEKQ